MQRTFDDLGTPLCDVTFCILDLETTGGDRNNDTITEIGAIKMRGGVNLGTFQTLVNPGRAIPPSITILTGISDCLVLPAPRIEQVLPSLLEFCRDSVIVGHNVRFDIGFLNAALIRSKRPALANTTIDTLALARRLVRDEVPDCRLGTLSARFRLDHQPSHRALDDALATADLLHLLLERAANFGVLGLDDLQVLPKIGGHPQVAKLKLTNHLPRSPGVYLFHDARGEVLYVGKATNLRQRVRSYFGSEDRRKIGPMLREAQRISHVETTDPLTAGVLELRYLHQLNPRYNKQGTTWNKYCFVRLSTDESWPRLAITKDPKPTGLHLGPLPSRTMANLVIEAIQSVVPLRRCTARLGRTYVAPPNAAECTAAQLGVAACPCSGTADPTRYSLAVDMVRRGLGNEPQVLLAPLRERMLGLARAHRFEEAAAVRDRAQALAGAIRRQRMLDHLRQAQQVEFRVGDILFELDHGRLASARRDGTLPIGLPIPPPAMADLRLPLPREAADETLCLARFIDSNSHRIELLSCSGEWSHPRESLPSFDATRSSVRSLAEPADTLTSTAA
ncbi:MAG: DEDD exonuclease domain-containing protein [Ilumatobacteraceae bacterium]